jgi:hypothetical protein
MIGRRQKLFQLLVLLLSSATSQMERTQDKSESKIKVAQLANTHPGLSLG